MKTGPKAHKAATKSSAVKIDGKKIHYLTAGQGPAVVLLHGYTQTSRMWRPLIEKLKGKFTVFAPDLPGIGDSDVPKSGSDMKTAAIRIHALMKSLGITKARVVGHDIGLMVAYAYGAQFSPEVEKLVVMVDAFLFPGGSGMWSSPITTTISGTFGFYGPIPEALVKGREKFYFAYFWNDLAADKRRSVATADRNAYVAAYSRPGRMRAGWAYFAAWPDTAKDFAQMAKTETNDARSVHRRRKSQRCNSSPADETRGDYCHRGRLERYGALAHGGAASGDHRGIDCILVRSYAPVADFRPTAG